MKDKNIDPVFWLSKDSVLGDGVITIPSHLKIAGTVNMNIECSGKLVISESGKVNGNIKATEIFVFGNVKGDIVAYESITIHKSGVVNGHIASKKLIIEEGAVCNLGMAVGEDAHFKQKKPVKKTSTPSGNNGANAIDNGANVEGNGAVQQFRQSGNPDKQDVLVKKQPSAGDASELQSIQKKKDEIDKTVLELQDVLSTGQPSAEFVRNKQDKQPESHQNKNDEFIPYW